MDEGPLASGGRNHEPLALASVFDLDQFLNRGAGDGDGEFDMPIVANLLLSQSVPMNPARRAPRRPAFKQATPASVPIPGPTPAGPVDLGNAQAISQIMQALASMGRPDLLLQQIRSSIPPAPVTKTKDLSNEQRLAVGETGLQN